VAKLLRDPKHVEHVENFWGDRRTAAGSQSSDAKGAYVEVHLVGNQGDTTANASVDEVYKDVASMPAPPGIKAYVTGPGALAADRREYGDRSLKTITVVTIVIITIMLLIAYRRISTALIMLFTILIELGAARGVVATLGYYNIIGLSTFAVNLLVVLVIARIGRLHHFPCGPRSGGPLARPRPHRHAYYTMHKGTAHVVLGSGLTVAGAMFCMSFTRLPRCW
jgi:putative drug exporter of the RND superfamily